MDESRPRLSYHRGVLMAALLLIGTLVSLTTAASASAGATRVLAPFSPNPIPGFSAPSGVAVDDATGNVFVTDEPPSEPFGDGKVRIVGPDGGAPISLSASELNGLNFGEGAAGIAYDNAATSPAKGTLYVFQTGKVLKFTRDAGEEKYKAAGEIAAPGAEGSGGVAVDSQGNVWLGDFSSEKVRQWSPAGDLLHEYNLSSTPTNRPSGIAVDSAGDLFVQRQGGGGVYKFPSNGSGEIEIGNPSPVVTDFASGVAYDPANNRVAVTLAGGVLEFDATTLAQIETRPFGRSVLGSSPERPAYSSVIDRLYVADRSTNNYLAVFGAVVPLPTVAPTVPTGVTGTKATLNGTVNAEGLPVTSCVFEYGVASVSEHTLPCEGAIPPDSASHIVSAAVSGLTPNGATYRYRISAVNENGSEQSEEETFTTLNTVVTEAATNVSTDVATLHGTLRPEGSQYTSCQFEYGLTTSVNFEHNVTCNPPANSITPDFAPHSVSAAVVGLQPNATYRFRLTATNGIGPISGQTLTYSQTGPPKLSEVRARDASQDSAVVEGKVDPRNFQTNYYFEWGPTSAYGNRAPVSSIESSAGSGDQPVPVAVTLSGLAPAATYHYRLVAQSDAGETRSPDTELETLNACELPEGRCFEMVSPREAGPFAMPGRVGAQEEMNFQASRQSGSLAYSVYGGLPEATRGASVLYQANLGSGATGWTSSQFAPPILVRNEMDGTRGGPGSNSSTTLGISQDLGCAVIESNQPLTSDATTRTVVEAGGANLFRRNPDGSYTAITDIPPTNLDAVAGYLLRTEYGLAGFSQDCSKIIFASRYRYPGVPAAATFQTGEEAYLYEWQGGSIRSVGSVPAAGGGEVLAGAVPGGAGRLNFGIEEIVKNLARSVSVDGSRVFFTAERQKSANPAEIGQVGIFVRENGTSTRDVSLSETGTPDEGAKYQGAAVNGSRVFFTANAGLTNNASSEGTDLYEYDLEAEHLTDLSVDHDPGGAGVSGFIGASEDGSSAYFVARGQLVPGRGSTFEANASAGTLSVYGVTDGIVSYAGRVTDTDASTASGFSRGEQSKPRSAFVSANGRYLLFQSSANVTGYVSGGVPEAYLYSAGDDSEPTVCVSCRQDGRPSFTPASNAPLRGAIQINANELYEYSKLVIRDGEPIVFFASLDRLAPGASQGDADLGRTNLYEWAHGQVFLITTEPPGLKAVRGSDFDSKEWTALGDASANGEDLYFVTPSSLTWEDGDGRLSVYDARIGGGFPQPGPPPSPCNPAVEGSCSGSSMATPPAAPGAGSAAFNGPGNKKHKKHKQGQKHKKHHKKKHHKKKHHKKKTRMTHSHRRAGK